MRRDQCRHTDDQGRQCEAYGEQRYDRHGIYSGRACDKHAKHLPGQGDAWNYEPEHGEDIEPDDWPGCSIGLVDERGPGPDYDADGRL